MVLLALLMKRPQLLLLLVLLRLLLVLEVLQLLPELLVLVVVDLPGPSHRLLIVGSRLDVA